MAAQQALRRFPGMLDTPPTNSTPQQHPGAHEDSPETTAAAPLPPTQGYSYGHDVHFGGPTDPYLASTAASQGGLRYRPCTTISKSEKYDLAIAIDQLYQQGLRSASIILPGEVAHVYYPYAPGHHADVLIISSGCVVAWGMTESEVQEKILPLLAPAEIGPYPEPESEDMDYIEEKPVENKTETIKETKNHEENGTEKEDEPLHSTMVGDVIVIRGVTYTQRLLAKAAFSSGLARSTKLANLENLLDKHINTTKKYIDNLANGRRLGIRGKTVLMLTGKLLRIRGQLNLYSELIETPDLYWSEPELESLYVLISRKLDVAPRIAILNKKLDYASESLSTLKSHISEEQSVRLEWMIVILIMVEVCFETSHFVEKYHEKRREPKEIRAD